MCRPEYCLRFRFHYIHYLLEDIQWRTEELIRFSIAYEAKSLDDFPFQFLTCEP